MANSRKNFMSHSREGASITAESLRLRKPPEPPKYLMTASPDGEVGFLKIRNVPPTVRPAGFEDKPLATMKTNCIPMKSFDSPPHSYIHFRPEQKRKVDSKSDSKMSPLDSTLSMNTPSPKQLGNNNTLRFAGSMALSKGSSSPSINAATTPTNVSIPRPYQPLQAGDFQYSQMLHNRAASGAILGTPVANKVVDSSRVPYLPQPYINPTMVAEDEQSDQTLSSDTTYIGAQADSEDLPVGPDRPTKALNETWSACWDDEAGAVYYYNHISGEATWILPDTSLLASTS